MIALVDYGCGNIQAFANIYKKLNCPVTIARTVPELEAAEKIILPGVGAFDWAMTLLEESGLRECLDEMVKIKKRPVLGVCVGMQIMANTSEEGKLDGLGWIDAKVKKFDILSGGLRTYLPHMGWNDVRPYNDECIFKNIQQPRFYFLHSYYFSPENDDDSLASTEYGEKFVSAVKVDNVYGTQFHPEKSHDWGVQLLKNFAEL